MGGEAMREIPASVRAWIFWALFVALWATLTLMLPGCEVVMRRPHLVTERIRGEAEEQHARAHVLEAHARIAEAYANCLEAKFPKGVPSVAKAESICGPPVTSPVTVVVDFKRYYGVGPSTQLQLMPSIPFAGALGALE
jgi:hypothetical protein